MSLSFDCTPAASFTPPLESAGVYTYTATDPGTCSFVGLTSTSSVTFADPLPDPDLFYFAGNEITVESTSTGGDVAAVRIEEIVVTSPRTTNTANTVSAVTELISNEEYTYRVTTLPPDEDVSVELKFMTPLSGLVSRLESGGSTGTFEYEEEEAGGYLSIEATITGTKESLKVIYPILSRGILPQTDSDNDGVPDTIEMANSNDPDAEEILLASASTGTTPGTTIEVPTGYRVTLGDIARRNSHHQAQLEDSLIPDRGGLPPDYGDEGVFEFNVYLPQGVNTAYVSIPLLQGTLNEDRGYVKYTTVEEGWKSFDHI